MQAIRCTALEHSHTPAEEKSNILGKFILVDHLNMGVVRKFRPELADICDEGIDFEVLIWPGEQMFPRLIEVLQEVGNLGQQAAQGESRWEVCLKMHKAAITIGGTASQTLSSDEVWLQVARSAKRGNPTFKSEIDDLARFTRLFAGESAERLHAINAFARSVPAPRFIKGDVLRALACDVVLGPDGAGLMEFRMDCLRVHASKYFKYYINTIYV